eukprot:5402661-Pyramimonas_sp.AAC.1
MCDEQGNLPSQAGNRPDNDLESRAMLAQSRDCGNSCTVGAGCRGGSVEVCCVAGAAKVLLWEKRRRSLNDAKRTAMWAR